MVNKKVKQLKNRILKFVGFPEDDAQGREDNKTLSGMLDDLIKESGGNNGIKSN